MKSQRGLFAKASILHYHLYWYVKFICISLWRHLCIVNLIYNGDIATNCFWNMSNLYIWQSIWKTIYVIMDHLFGPLIFPEIVSIPPMLFTSVDPFLFQQTLKTHISISPDYIRLTQFLGVDWWGMKRI